MDCIHSLRCCLCRDSENGICRIYLRQPQSGGGVKSAVISFIVIISVLLWKVTPVFLHLAAVKIKSQEPSKSTVGGGAITIPLISAIAGLIVHEPG